MPLYKYERGINRKFLRAGRIKYWQEHLLKFVISNTTRVQTTSLEPITVN